MADKAAPRQADIDRLYSLPLDEFTSARDELARDLRRSGDRDASSDIKGLRKPTAAAWALNQVRRAQRDKTDELLKAGARLREAQQRLLAGEGREPFEEAVADERRLVDELAEDAGRALSDAGQRPSAATTEKLHATLHAAASNPDAREEFAAGRLVREYEPTGLGPLPEAGISPRIARGRKAKQAPGRSDAARERHLRQLEQWLENAHKRRWEAEEKREEAEDRLRHAREQATRAGYELEQAEAAQEVASQRAEEVAEEVASLERALREATEPDAE